MGFCYLATVEAIEEFCNRFPSTADEVVDASRDAVTKVADGDRGRVARPFGFALTDPGVRLSRTRLFPKVTRLMPAAASMVA